MCITLVMQLMLRAAFIDNMRPRIDLVTVSKAILPSRQPRKKLQCLHENLMSNNFRKMAVQKKNMNCKLKLQSKGFC